MENSSNNTIDLRRLFNLCRKHLKFLITCTIALALAGFIVSKFIMTPKYTATTQLLVNQKNENNANGQAYNNQQADIQVINTYKDIITSPVILKETKKELANPVKVVRKAQPAKYKTLAIVLAAAADFFGLSVSTLTEKTCELVCVLIVIASDSWLVVML